MTPEIKTNTTDWTGRRRGPRPSSTFPAKLFKILSNPEISHIITWMPHGRSWRVLQPKTFSDVVAPEYFSHQSKYSSFMRQVNGWGFKRITRGPDRNSYYHELFIRDQPELATTMVRRSGSSTPSSGRNETSAGENQSEESEPNFYEMCGIPPSTIPDTLKHDNNEEEYLHEGSSPREVSEYPYDTNHAAYLNESKPDHNRYDTDNIDDGYQYNYPPHPHDRWNPPPPSYDSRGYDPPGYDYYGYAQPPPQGWSSAPPGQMYYPPNARYYSSDEHDHYTAHHQGGWQHGPREDWNYSYPQDRRPGY